MHLLLFRKRILLSLWQWRGLRDSPSCSVCSEPLWKIKSSLMEDPGFVPPSCCLPWTPVGRSVLQVNKRSAKAKMKPGTWHHKPECSIGAPNCLRNSVFLFQAPLLSPPISWQIMVGSQKDRPLGNPAKLGFSLAQKTSWSHTTSYSGASGTEAHFAHRWTVAFENSPR